MSLGKEDYINHVQIFENKGEMMGCSNPHPHGQIWSSEFIPEEPAKELQNLENYEKKHGVGMLERYKKRKELQKVNTLVTGKGDEMNIAHANEEMKVISRDREERCPKKVVGVVFGRLRGSDDVDTEGSSCAFLFVWGLLESS